MILGIRIFALICLVIVAAPRAYSQTGPAPVPKTMIGSWGREGDCKTPRNKLVISPTTARIGTGIPFEIIYYPDDDGPGRGAIHSKDQRSVDNFEYAQSHDAIIYNSMGFHMGGQITYTRCVAEPASSQRWTAYSRTAAAITGDITLSPDQIIFQNSLSLRLSYVSDRSDINLRSFGLAAQGPVHVFRIDDAGVVRLLNGSTLCGPLNRPIPATFLATVTTGEKQLGVAFFSGSDELAESNISSRLCGTYSYIFTTQ